MQSRAFALLLSGAIGLLATGCASSTPTIRGQGPDANFASWGGPAEQVYGQPCPNGMCQPGYGGHNGGGHFGHSNGGAGMNLPFRPVHRNFQTYHAPSNLMYPPQNSAPALYQYPYYTLRGPTDFFME